MLEAVPVVLDVCISLPGGEAEALRGEPALRGCLVPSEHKAPSWPARPAAPVMCRACMLGAYLHGCSPGGVQQPALYLCNIPAATEHHLPACTHANPEQAWENLSDTISALRPRASSTASAALSPRQTPLHPSPALATPVCAGAHGDTPHEPAGSGVCGVSGAQTGGQLPNSSVGGNCQVPCAVWGDARVCLMGQGETLQGAAPLQGWLLCPAAGIGTDADL